MTEEIIREFLEAVRDDSLTAQRELGLKASGKSGDSLRIQADEKRGALFGSPAIRFQVKGRGPGKFPPPQTIQDWIEDKPIPVVGITVESLAYLIGRKIARQGTDIYLGRRPGLDLQEIIGKNMRPFVERLAREITVETFEQIKAA